MRAEKFCHYPLSACCGAAAVPSANGRYGRNKALWVNTIERLRDPLSDLSLRRMDFIYPINIVGHNEWMESGYALELASGDVITRDGEVLGIWRVVEYDPEDDYSSGRFEFVKDGQDLVKFFEEFAMLDVRTSRGFALSNLTRTIREWNDARSL